MDLFYLTTGIHAEDFRLGVSWLGFAVMIIFVIVVALGSYFRMDSDKDHGWIGVFMDIAIAIFICGLVLWFFTRG